MKKDKIIISNKQTAKQIQEDFNKMFPFLKIEFISGVEKFSDNQLIKSSGKNNKGFMHVTPQTTATELVQLFYENYNMKIEILRHSGKAWLKTSKTNYWTLEQQNKLGEELSKSSEEIKM